MEKVYLWPSNYCPSSNRLQMAIYPLLSGFDLGFHFHAGSTSHVSMLTKMTPQVRLPSPSIAAQLWPPPPPSPVFAAGPAPPSNHYASTPRAARLRSSAEPHHLCHPNPSRRAGSAGSSGRSGTTAPNPGHQGQNHLRGGKWPFVNGLQS